MNYSGAPGLEFGQGNTKIDPGVAAELPKGCRVVLTAQHGTSFWANTGRIDVKLQDGTPKSFFIKVVSKEAGRLMVHGEFESAMAIHKVLPEYTPKPIGWGSYKTIPDTYFYLCEFRQMTHDLPDPYRFTASLACLHENSRSPTGKFGFHVTTCAGNLPQYCGWEESWEVFFTKNLRMALDYEVAAHGSEPEIDRLACIIFDRVIPRLLRPLESGGRSVKPSLVHGNLWCGNTGIDVNTGTSLVFDAGCFYAHNEYEFGKWRAIGNRFGPDYIKAYHTYMPISPPEEDFEGRQALYQLRFDAQISALFPRDRIYRTRMIQGMRDLAARYG
ncbi:hypothetical protein VTJ83DRAFT_7024 [Remersonia thermophila]|uniref:protein-ribulosamine 3-kinase n=1 Tax=Remersonia thermophila TaxID=72144 RepID=A0ABR4D3D7_9PEZI